jgi:putative ABC transport system ATP-binding protein
MRIVTANLTRLYGVGQSQITAVNKANLRVENGEFIAIMGPSGSGKTTLLNLIGLNDYPTSGKIFVDDEDVSLLSGNKRRKTRLFRMGFVFQTFNLLPTLGALENVELPMALAGRPQTEQRKRAIALLETVGLRDRLNSRPKEMSTGEMQRVAIARALANDPEAIIADEPTGELDSKTAKEVSTLLFDVNQKDKRTVIAATHDEKIVNIADRVYSIQEGTLETRKQR